MQYIRSEKGFYLNHSRIETMCVKPMNGKWWIVATSIMADDYYLFGYENPKVAQDMLDVKMKEISHAFMG
jgi:hypothetical protein